MTTTPPESLARALARLQNALHAALNGETTATDFCRHARSDMPVFDGLPPRYVEVLNALLDRLESSALFTEESCSFSQRDQFASLQLWLGVRRALQSSGR